MPFTLDPAVAQFLEGAYGGDPPPPLPRGELTERRERINGLGALFAVQIPDPGDVDTKDYYTTTKDGHQLLLRWFQKRGSTPKSAWFWMHGGGMIALNVQAYDSPIKNYISKSGVAALVVEYRLAPEHPAPGIIEDCYTGFTWLHEHAGELGIDPNRIGVAGDSGGGCLAAALTHYCKKLGGPKIAKQMLIYPMLDDRNVEEDPLIASLATWSAADNYTAWTAVLGSRRGTDDVSPIDAPARMTVEDAKGLPPAYIDVGELDYFRDEGFEYARKLTKAGVSTAFQLGPGLNHASDVWAPQLDICKYWVEQRVKFLQSI